MPTVWFALKKSFHCRSEPRDVYDPQSVQSQKHQLTAIVTRKNRSGCSRSLANLKDVIHGNKKSTERAPSCSPRSIGSSEFLNPMSHEVILSNSRCELKITGLAGYNSSALVGTLRPGTPGPGTPNYHYLRDGKPVGCYNNVRNNDCSFVDFPLPPPAALNGSAPSTPRFSNDSELDMAALVACQKCGEQFAKADALESHHLASHAVTELLEGDSSRNIVEIIFRTSWLKSENPCGRIDRVLKVHNMQKMLARFEEYRETVKAKASKLPKKHPRCLADGNELLRFHGTTIMCSLGMNGSSSLCNLEGCNVCRIIRTGFPVKEGAGWGGIYTAATSGKAHDSIALYGNDSMAPVKRAMLVCRVIAGRVHRPLGDFEASSTPPGFDSVAGKVGPYSNIEELFVLNPNALLPCFVIICKT